jgi:hypothetical protein
MRHSFGPKTSQLYPFEIGVIEAVKSRLGSDTATQLQRQVDSINKVQRHTNGKEVNLYCIVRGKPAFDESLRFPGIADEAILATVRMTHRNRSAVLKIELWLANGRLFSLLFDKPPKQFFAGYSLEDVNPAISEVTIGTDPSLGTEILASGETSAVPGTLKGWPQALLISGQLQALRPPVPASQREALIAQIDARLPLDYLELVDQTDGALVGTCKVHGLTSIRKVVLPDVNYYILAELDNASALAIKDGSRSGELYRLHYESDDVQPLSQSFRSAMTELCCKSAPSQ